MTRKLITQYPAGAPEWATLCRWEDAGRPPLNHDGTWEENPAIAASGEGPP